MTGFKGPLYYQSEDSPFLIVRQPSFTWFEKFNRKTKEWEFDGELFYDVCEGFDFDEIDEKEALRIVEILKNTDTDGMSRDELCALVK